MFQSKLFEGAAPAAGAGDVEATVINSDATVVSAEEAPAPSLRLGPEVLAPGYVLQDYRVESVLGMGGFGITYRALDTQLEEVVVIKEYMPADLAQRVSGVTVSVKSDDARDTFNIAMDSFIREAQTLARIRNYNIVRVRRLFKENDTAYIVMDFEDGVELKALLARNPIALSEEQLMGLITPLLEGLEWIHREQILHRDIKPANIFVRRDGSPLLIDFGAARHLAGSGQEANYISHGYSPIEQYVDEDTQGAWTDIYSLGVTLYEAMSGVRPAPASARFLAVGAGHPDPLPPLAEVVRGQYSPRLIRFIQSAIAIKASERPQSVAAWRNQLFGSSYPQGKLFAGQKKSFGQVAPGLTRLKIGLGWNVTEYGGQPVDLDASALLLGRGGSVRSDQDVVFYNNLVSPCGAVRHLGDNRDGAGDGDDEIILVDLSALPTDVATIVFAVTLHDPERRGIDFGSVQNATIRVVNADTDEQLFFYDLSKGFSEENAVVIGELYRHHDQWIFGAETQGFTGGMGELLRNFGVETTD